MTRPPGVSGRGFCLGAPSEPALSRRELRTDSRPHGAQRAPVAPDAPLEDGLPLRPAPSRWWVWQRLFEHKYTSGVIAWSPEDAPSDAQIDRVVDEFEKTAWAGLEPDRYAWSAIEHREAGGGVDVHVLAARVDLETGKSLNIAAPGWQKTFDALRDWQNHENGWSRPDDPERARDVQPGYRAYIEAANHPLDAGGNRIELGAGDKAHESADKHGEADHLGPELQAQGQAPSTVIL